MSRFRSPVNGNLVVFDAGDISFMGSDLLRHGVQRHNSFLPKRSDQVAEMGHARLLFTGATQRGNVERDDILMRAWASRRPSVRASEETTHGSGLRSPT